MPAAVAEPKKPLPSEASSTAAEIKAKTDAALKATQGGGLTDPGFESGLQAALDKDAGKTKTTPEPVKAATTPVAKPTDATKPAAETAPAKVEMPVVEDVPGELLGIKKPEKKKEDSATTEATEAERQKALAEQTQGMSAKAAERFKAIENRAHEAEKNSIAEKRLREQKEQETAALKKRLDELEAKTTTAPDVSEVEKLRKQVEEMDAVIQQAALADHPKFRATYDEPIAEEIAAAKTMLPAESADEVAELLAMPESKKRNERISAIVDTLTSIQQVKLLNTVAAVDRLSNARNKQLKQWKENKVHLEADALRQQQTEQARAKEVTDVAFAKAMQVVGNPETGLLVFRKTEDNEDWNSRVDARVATARRAITNGNLTPEGFAELAMRAAAADELQRLFVGQRMLVEKLREEIQALGGAGPTAGDDAGGERRQPDNKSFVDATTDGLVSSGALKG